MKEWMDDTYFYFLSSLAQCKKLKPPIQYLNPQILIWYISQIDFSWRRISRIFSSYSLSLYLLVQLRSICPLPFHQASQWVARCSLWQLAICTRYLVLCNTSSDLAIQYSDSGHSYAGKSPFPPYCKHNLLLIVYTVCVIAKIWRKGEGKRSNEKDYYVLKISL